MVEVHLLLVVVVEAVVEEQHRLPASMGQGQGREVEASMPVGWRCSWAAMRPSFPVTPEHLVEGGVVVEGQYLTGWVIVAADGAGTAAVHMTTEEEEGVVMRSLALLQNAASCLWRKGQM